MFDSGTFESKHSYTLRNLPHEGERCLKFPEIDSWDKTPLSIVGLGDLYDDMLPTLADGSHDHAANASGGGNDDGTNDKVSGVHAVKLRSIKIPPPP